MFARWRIREVYNPHDWLASRANPDPEAEIHAAAAKADPGRSRRGGPGATGALRRRLAEHGFTLHLPAPGRRWDDAPRLPVSADELSDAVIRMRRGDL